MSRSATLRASATINREGRGGAGVVGMLSKMWTSLTRRWTIFVELVEREEGKAEKRRPSEAYLLLLPTSGILTPDTLRQRKDPNERLVSAAIAGGSYFTGRVRPCIRKR